PLTGESKQERKVISVLFADLVGFTGRSHDGDPEDVRDTLHAYHGAAKEAIESFGGNLEKFIGDAVMAVFGAPISHGDDAERAVRAGLKVLAASEDANGGARAGDRPPELHLGSSRRRPAPAPGHDRGPPRHRKVEAAARILRSRTRPRRHRCSGSVPAVWRSHGLWSLHATDPHH